MYRIHKATRLFGYTRPDGTQWLSDGFCILPLRQSSAVKDVLTRERFAKSPNWHVLRKGGECEALAEPMPALTHYFDCIPTLRVHPSVLWEISKRGRAGLGIGQVFYGPKGVSVVGLEFLPDNFRDLNCFQADSESALYCIGAEGTILAICMPTRQSDKSALLAACAGVLNAAEEEKS